MVDSLKVKIAEALVEKLVDDFIAEPSLKHYLTANTLKSEYAKKAFFGSFPVEDYRRIFKTSEKTTHFLDLYVEERVKQVE